VIKQPKKIYIIYDGRGITKEQLDDATILEICESLKEAKEAIKDYGSCCIWSYDEDVDKLINPVKEGSYFGIS